MLGYVMLCYDYQFGVWKAKYVLWSPFIGHWDSNTADLLF